jgi:triosephosphate isomerase
MSRPIFAANWKMNHGPTDAREFFHSFLQYYPRQSDRQVIFFPSSIALAAVVEGLKGRSDIRVGVQNIHWEAKGAFTGEISGSMARDAGAHYALVGHSERRHVFGESDEETGRKVAACFRSGLTPVLCVGEKLEERESSSDSCARAFPASSRRKSRTSSSPTSRCGRSEPEKTPRPTTHRASIGSFVTN